MKNNVTLGSIVISTIVLIFFCSCRSTPDLTEKEVYTIINEITADDCLTINKVCWEFQDIQSTSDYAKEFTNDDIVFSRRQNSLFGNTKIKPGCLKWRKRRSEAFEYTIVDTLCNHGILYHIFFPIISIDRKKVLIGFQEDCNCTLGGQGGIDLYEKKNEHWARTKSFDHWVSENTFNINNNGLLLAGNQRKNLN